jgi:hypothetical protein
MTVLPMPEYLLSHNRHKKSSVLGKNLRILGILVKLRELAQA